MRLKKIVAISMMAYCVSIGNGFSAAAPQPIGQDFDDISTAVTALKARTLVLEQERDDLKKKVVELPQLFRSFVGFVLWGPATGKSEDGAARLYVKTLCELKEGDDDPGFAPMLDRFHFSHSSTQDMFDQSVALIRNAKKLKVWDGKIETRAKLEDYLK
jgi:hypothetical protein